MIRDRVVATEAGVASTTRAAVSALADRDAALPDLAALLDPRSLAELLGHPLTVERVRYKRGASIVVAVRSESGERSWVVSYSDPEKLEKSARRAREAGLAATPHGDRSLSGPAAADRVLARHLVRLGRDRPGVLGGALLGDGGLDGRRIARYNPHRRLVLRADGLAVKINARPTTIGDEAARRLAAQGLPVLAPTPLGDNVSTTPWWGAADLSASTDPALESAAGRALGALHAHVGSAVPGLPTVSARAESTAAVEAVATVLPALRERVARLASRIEGLLNATEPAVLLHGDWSLDQVLSDGRDVRLIDFDRVAVGPAGRDLGSAIAAGASESMIDGYVEAGGVLDQRTLPAWIALSMLQRAIDPFRQLRSDWPSAVADAVGRAEEVVS